MKKISTKIKNSSILRRFLKKKLSIAGLVIIMMAILVSILGASIRLDDSYQSNNQSLQIAIKKPGYLQWFLKIESKHIKSFSEGVSSFFLGDKYPDKYIPIEEGSFKFDSESGKVMVRKYIGEDDKGIEATYDITEIINFKAHIIRPEENLASYLVENHIVKKYYLLGTDRFGRDVLSRLMSGTWVSLLVGFISVLVSLIIGIFLGTFSGYFGGKVDAVITWIINVTWSIPTLLLAISITIALGKSFWQIFFAIGLTMWVEVARVVRGQIMSIREQEFVEATRALGFRPLRIIFKHIVPNVTGSVVVISSLNFATAILIEAGLSYLGIGVQAPQSSWGKMISEHKGYIVTGDAYLAIIPGIAILLMVLSFVFVGNGLRDVLDSKQK